MNPLKIVKYGKYFTNAKFLTFMSTYGKKFAFAQRALLLFYCMQDKETPKYVKAIIAGALGYMILPIDLLPDGIPGLGLIDDVAILAIAYKLAKSHIKESHREKAKKWMPIGSGADDK